MPPKPNELLQHAAQRRVAVLAQVVRRGSAGSRRAQVERRPAAGRSRSASSADRPPPRRRPRRACGRSRPWSNCTASSLPNTAATARSSAASLLGVRGAVQVDVVDRRPAASAGVGERGAHRGDRAGAFGMRRAHVVAVAALADAEQPAAAAGAARRARAARTPPPSPIERPRALGVPRAADLGRQQLERVEAVQRRQAQAVDAADDGGVDQAGCDQARRAARTPWRSTSRRSTRPSAGPCRSNARAHEVRRARRCCASRVAQVGRQRAGRVAPAVGRARSAACPRCWCRGTRRRGARP